MLWLVVICVLQPFSPLLFTHGPPTGPDRLIRKLSKKITFADACEEWRADQNREALEEDENNPMTATHLCTSCYLLGKEPYMLPVKQFGVHKADDFFQLYMSHGQWTKCLECQQRSGIHPQKNIFKGDTFSSEKTAHEKKLCILCNEKGGWKTPLAPALHCCGTCHFQSFAGIFSL